MGQQWRRRVALLPVAVAIAPGLALLLAGTAQAAIEGGITNPTTAENGRVVRAHTNLTMRSEIRRSLPTESGTSRLTLLVPGETEARVLGQNSSWSNNGQVVTFTLNTGCATFSAAVCTAPAPNGAYQVALSGPRNDSRTFSLEVAPATPSSVQATEVAGEKVVRVTWSANPETDVVGYDLYSGSGSLVQSGLTTTSYDLHLPETGYGGDYTFAVQAHRSAGPGTGRTLASPLSSAATVNVREPEPEPAPDGGGTGSGSGGTGSGSGGSSGGTDGGDFGSGSGGAGSGGSTGGGTSGGSAGGSDSAGGSTGGGDNGGFTSGARTSTTTANPRTAQRRAFGLTFKSFAPKLGQPKLPPLPKFTEPVEPDGTYEETLDFGEQEVAFPETVTRPGGVRGVIDTVYSTVFEGRRLWTSLAWGVLLMLGAAHVRVFLGKPATY